VFFPFFFPFEIPAPFLFPPPFFCFLCLFLLFVTKATAFSFQLDPCGAQSPNPAILPPPLASLHHPVFLSFYIRPLSHSPLFFFLHRTGTIYLFVVSLSSLLVSFPCDFFPIFSSFPPLPSPLWVFFRLPTHFLMSVPAFFCTPFPPSTFLICGPWCQNIFFPSSCVKVGSFIITYFGPRLGMFFLMGSF